MPGQRSATRALVGVIVAFLAVAGLAQAAGAAAVSGPDEVALLNRHNDTRAQNGLAPLADDVAARDVARAWAQHMADTQTLSHNPNLAAQVNAQVTNQWTRLGENVGRAPSVDAVNNAFLNSSGHRGNILGDYNRVGVGAVRDGSGQLWVAVVFLKGPPLPVVPRTTWSPFADPYAFANQQYADFLTRSGEPGGVEAWATAMRAGRQSAAGEIDAFMGSPEFGQLVSPIVRLYFAAFTRIPDQPGLQAWINSVRNGNSMASVANSFATSQEFRNRYDRYANRPFVDQLYRNVFGRPADTGGLDYWAGKLDRGELTRGGVLLGISASTEYLTAIRSETLTTMAYVGMLRRSPDQGGFDYWVGRLDAGRSVQELLNGFLGSTEYRGRFGA